jgi:hypothetical protein
LACLECHGELPRIQSSEKPLSVLVLAVPQIEGDIVYLHASLKANPALYLDELQTHLLSVWNINLSPPSLEFSLGMN